MLPYCPIWSKKVQNGPKWSLIVKDFTKQSKMVTQKNLNFLKKFKNVSRWFKMGKFVKTVYYGPILSKTVQNGPEKF